MKFGVMTALITPLLEDGVTLNEPAYAAIIEDQLKNGVHSLLTMGGTGESLTLPRETKKRAIEVAVKVIDHRVPVIASVVELSVYDAVESAKMVKKAGADVLLLSNPYGGNTRLSGVIDFFKKVDEAVGMPMIIYNFPGRTGYNVSPDVVGALMDAVPNICGIKECAERFDQTMELIGRFGDRLAVLSGNEFLGAWELLCGADGCVVATGNVMIKEIVKLYNIAKSGDIAKTTAYGLSLFPLMRALFKSPNPGPSKYGMILRGFDAGRPTIPCVECEEPVKAEVEAEMKKLGII